MLMTILVFSSLVTLGAERRRLQNQRKEETSCVESCCRCCTLTIITCGVLHGIHQGVDKIGSWLSTPTMRDRAALEAYLRNQWLRKRSSKMN